MRCHQCKSVTFTPCGLDRLKSQENTNHNCSRVQCTIFSWWDILAAFDDEDKRKMTVSGLYDGDDTDRDRLDQDEPFSNLLHLEAVPVRQVISLIVLLLSTPMDNTTCQDVSTMIRHSSFPLRIGNLFRNFTLEGVTVYKDLYNSVFTLLHLLAESEQLKNILSEAHIRTTRLPVFRMINDPKLFIMSTGEIFKSTRSIASCLVNLNYNASNFLKYHLDPDRNHNFREALPGTATICEQVLDLYKAMPGKKFTLRWVYDGEMKRMPLHKACSALGETNHGSNQRTRDFLEEHVNKQIALNHDFNRRHLDFGGHELVEIEETE
ncbi:hypothetical protein B0J14DRAFT_592547 [Halenospora varia]|nr:hypothetical protein B0J14DRAFT_592547 [Halenospora varia]